MGTGGKLARWFFVAFLGVIASVSAQSLWDGKCCEPCRTFEIGGEALYWKACAFNGVWAATFGLDQGISGPVTPHIHKNHYEWGFKLFAKYYTPDLCNFIGVNWIHHQSRKRKTLDPSGPEFIFSPDYPEPLEFSPGFFRASTKVRSRYEAVDLEGGHRLVFCNCDGFTMYLLASLRYVDIEDKYRTLFQDPLQVIPGEEEAALQLPPNSVGFCHNDRFHGGGPRLGLRFRLPIWCGFGITGRVATSVLVGCKRSSVSLTQTDFDGAVTFARATKHKPCEGGACVPQLDAKLGIDYCFTCCFTFKIEAGWAWEHAFHALNHFRLRAFPDPFALAVTEYDFQNNPYAFCLGGLYLRASVTF